MALPKRLEPSPTSWWRLECVFTTRRADSKEGLKSSERLRRPQQLQTLQITIVKYHNNYSAVSLHDQWVPNIHILDAVLLITVSSLACFVLSFVKDECGCTCWPWMETEHRHVWTSRL